MGISNVCSDTCAPLLLLLLLVTLDECECECVLLFGVIVIPIALLKKVEDINPLDITKVRTKIFADAAILLAAAREGEADEAAAAAAAAEAGDDSTKNEVEIGCGYASSGVELVAAAMN